MSPTTQFWKSKTRSAPKAIAGGALIGMLGGLIGLGGAEFRLPLLISIYGFGALEAVIVNKAMSLLVVATALPFRSQAVSFNEIASHWTIILNILAGSLIGAWFGASWATRLASKTLFRVISAMLVLIAVILLAGHNTLSVELVTDGQSKIIAGVIAGLGIGVVASMMGVAGGELLIPTLILLFGVNIKLAGSLSLAISLPTMLVGFGRYSRDQSFDVLKNNGRFFVLMAFGSLLGSFIGGQLLSLISPSLLLPFLALILAVSAVKIWCHE